MPTNKLQFKRLSSSAVLPTRAHHDDACVDLYADQSVTIEPLTRAVVDTGVAVAIPQGFAGEVCSRSGNAAKLGLFVLNAPGIIDSSYRDAIKVILFNSSQTPLEIVYGQRIGQMKVSPVLLSEVQEVEELPAPASSRQGGLGSTGA